MKTVSISIKQQVIVGARLISEKNQRILLYIKYGFIEHNHLE